MSAFPASIYNLYSANAKGYIASNFTVPAFNVRGLTFETAGAIFRTAKKLNVGAFIFELARSEMGYTSQPPKDYVSSVLRAATQERWDGPVFIQGDHFQFKEASENELSSIKNLITESVDAGVYNIDIDASTLVELEKPIEKDQQELNIKYTSELISHIKTVQPEGVNINIGGEIGHIGGRNSTPADLEAYMNGLNKIQPGLDILKLSVQTGTSHGGKINPDGSMQEMQVDLDLIKQLSTLAREKYKMAGIVQHGASTLPLKILSKLPQNNTVEVHLATGLQNLIFDHEDFPKELLTNIHEWIDTSLTNEIEPNWTPQQAHYKLRKKGWGKFKNEISQIDAQIKNKLMEKVEKRVSEWFEVLNLSETRNVVDGLYKMEV